MPGPTDRRTSVGEQNGKPTEKPSSWAAALSKFGAGMLCLTLHQVGGMYFSLEVSERRRGGGGLKVDRLILSLSCFFSCACTREYESESGRKWTYCIVAQLSNACCTYM